MPFSLLIVIYTWFICSWILCSWNYGGSRFIGWLKTIWDNTQFSHQVSTLFEEQFLTSLIAISDLRCTTYLSLYSLVSSWIFIYETPESILQIYANKMNFCLNSANWTSSVNQSRIWWVIFRERIKHVIKLDFWNNVEELLHAKHSS